MRRLLSVILLTLLALTIPWRLAALFAEALVVSPGLTRTQSGTDDYWAALDLQARLERLGWAVQYKPGLADDCGCYGLTSFHSRDIYIEDALSWNARFAVLAHEAGHTLEPPRLTENQGEVFAEAVATLIARDGLRDHARYLASMRGDLFTMVAYEREIYATVATLQP